MIVPKSPTTQDDIRPCCPADPPAATTPHIVTRSSELLAISDWLTMPHRDQPSSCSHSHLHAQPLYVTYHLEALGNTTTTRFWTKESPLAVPPQSRTQASLSFCQFLSFGSLVTRYAGQEEGIHPARSFLALPSIDTFQAKSGLPHFTTTSFPANQPPTSKSKNKTHQHTFNMPFFYSKPIGGKNFGTSVHADRHGIRRGPWRFRIGRFNCFR